MANVNGGDHLDRDEFNNIINYYEGWKGKDSWPMTPEGEVDLKEVFHMMDYNKNGMLDKNEMVNAMMRDDYSVEDMHKVMEIAMGHMDENHEMNMDHWMMFIEDVEKHMGDMRDDGMDMGMGRMEIHMEENADGSS